MKKIRNFLASLVTAILTGIMLVACSVVPDSVEKAKERMERQGYSVTIDDDPELELKKYGAHTVLYAFDKDGSDNSIVAVRFQYEEQAENFYEDHDYNELHAVYRQEEEWVFWGTKEAEFDFTY